jgi:hypothetical protein
MIDQLGGEQQLFIGVDISLLHGGLSLKSQKPCS